MNALPHWIRAARPRTLIASLSPILIGSALASKAGSASFWLFLLILVTGVGIQISTNFANDLFDFLKGADTHERKGPIRVTQSGLLSIVQMKRATISIMGFTALSGSILVIHGGFSIALLLCLALVLALSYTAGPFPLAYLGIAEIFILIFFGPVACASSYYLQTLSWELTPFLAGLSPGLLSCSLLVINNLRDIAEDKKASKKTLVARFGVTFGKWEYTLAVLLAIATPLFLFDKMVYLIALCALPAALLIHSVWKTSDALAYNPLLGKTGKLLTLFTFIFCFSILI
ncbi:MAG: 1,4-dihydroxy-2-naphthoate octaprenyltransferase [Chlamydiae bacterium]|nr:1,4-dihydroxy-2-naphthoate octaprenyltransferase [Chlamydiota bacterium]